MSIFSASTDMKAKEVDIATKELTRFLRRQLFMQIGHMNDDLLVTCTWQLNVPATDEVHLGDGSA